MNVAVPNQSLFISIIADVARSFQSFLGIREFGQQTTANPKVETNLSALEIRVAGPEHL